MEIIYLLIPVSLLVVGLIIGAFIWAVKSGQFDDLEGPAHQILMDDDDPVNEPHGDPDPGKKEDSPHPRAAATAGPAPAKRT